MKGVREQTSQGGISFLGARSLLSHEEHRAIDDDAIAAGQAARDDDGILASRTEGDVSTFELPLCSLDVDGRASLVLDDRTDRNRHHPTGGTRITDACEHFRLEPSCGVLKLRDHADAARLRIECTSHTRDSPLKRSSG